MGDMKQTELDLFEEHILTEFFGDPGNIRIPPLFKIYAKKKWDIDLNTEFIQDNINIFEAAMRPVMDDRGLVNAEMFRKAVNGLFPDLKNFLDYIPMEDFRLVSLARHFTLKKAMEYVIINSI